MVNTLYHNLAQAKVNTFSDMLSVVKGEQLVETLGDAIAD